MKFNNVTVKVAANGYLIYTNMVWSNIGQTIYVAKDNLELAKILNTILDKPKYINPEDKK